MTMPLLRMNHVKKAFDGIYALRDVTFDVAAASCVALVGENGAGKSTLMKILSGVWPHGTYEGEVVFNGELLRLQSPLDGRRVGISIIHQELCLFPKLTVAENLFLTESFPYDGEPSQALWQTVRWSEMNRKAQALFAELGFDVPASALIDDLSVAQHQLVEIARAFHHKAKLLILDEPTSALSKTEVRRLFTVIEQMRERMAFIYISHKLDEVFELSDRIVVLRDGMAVADLATDDATASEVIHHMVGRPLKDKKRVSSTNASCTLLKVTQLSHHSSSGKRILDGINFELKAGEILGIAGLMGSGRSELLRSLLGILPGRREGEIYLKGESVSWNAISQAMESGIAFVPEDRKKEGLFLDHAIGFNLTISMLEQLRGPFGIVDLDKEEGVISLLAKKMGIKLNRISDPVRVLSGGNQQKVLLAKMVARQPVVLLLDEPTRGIDVGAKEEIYEIIRRLAEDGISIILVSSELPEILSLSDRVIVLREGRAVGELVNDHLTQEQIMSFAAGEVRSVG